MNQPRNIALAPPTSSYGFHCALKGLDFAQAIAQVTEALKTEVASVAHEVRARLERVRSMLIGPSGSIPTTLKE